MKKITSFVSEDIKSLLQRESMLFNSDYHGITHWQRVERNGLYLAQFTDADPVVISHFAYLHDCQRENEWEDPEHGPRAADFAKVYRHLFDVTDTQFEQICRACAGHTHASRSHCITLTTCWDSDRLDLGRVGITPDPQYLFTEEAKRIARDDDFNALSSFYFDLQSMG